MTGVEAYAFFSQPCLDAMDVGDMTASMIAHSETYEHIGEVAGLVHDLHIIWKEEQARRHVVVLAEDAWINHSFDLQIPPSLAWEYLTDPKYVRQWLQASDYATVDGKKNGRVGLGSVQHCAHGDNEITTFVIEDWHPFDYFTTRVVALPLDAHGLTTYRLEPISTGTRVHLLSGKLESVNSFKTTIVRIFGVLAFKKQLLKNYVTGGNVLKKLVMDDLASGKIMVETAV